MEEYIIKTGSLSDWQKWLNQWKHNYILEIITAQFIVTSLEYTEIAICLKRTPKEV